MLFYFLAQGQKCQTIDHGEVEILENSNNIRPRSNTYLPVVVHIIHQQDSIIITDEQVKAQLEVLNEDFSKTNANFLETPNVFQAVAADTEIQFCLASQDENGFPTNGITRTETNVNDIGLQNAYYKDNEGGKTGWDPKRYINIWVADMGDSGILGFSTFPEQADPPQSEGLCINYKYFGKLGAHQEAPHNLGRATTHEMGHYFGLAHIWGTLDTGCSDDDGFSDTPLQDKPNFDCPDFPSPDMCTQGNGTMFMNFMDYTNDVCQTMFTEQQKNKMWQTLNGPRIDLLNQATVSCTVLNETFQKNESWSFFPNPANSFLYLLDESPTNRDLLRIYNNDGKELINLEITNVHTEIDVQTLAPGIYLIQYKDHIRKMMKL